MARIVEITYRDDYSGEVVPEDQITEGFTFSIGSEKYRLDATEQTIEAIRKALTPFTVSARIVVGYGKTERLLTPQEYAEEQAALRELAEQEALPPVPPTPASTNGHVPSSDEVRDWAEKQPEFKGQLKARGRVPAAITTAYIAAH